MSRPFRFVRHIAPVLIALSSALAAQDAAATPGVFDALYDFAPTYVGARNGDLDINFASATLEVGDVLHLWSNQVGWLGDLGQPTFVWGIDRGSGAERLSSGSPGVGTGIVFDAVVVLTGNGFSEHASGFVTTFGPDGPVTTEITAAFAYDSVIGAVLPLALLPSTGFAAADYRVNLWTRDAPGNDHIADFAFDGGMLPVVDLRASAAPEPAAWMMMIAGFGLAGATFRRRRQVLAGA